MQPGEPHRLAVGFVLAGVVMLPVLRPKGPGHLAPLDVVMLMGIIAVVVWAGTTRRRLHLPYAVPVAGLIVTGCVAAMFGEDPGAGAVAVVQDIFLLGWCGAVASVCRTPGALRSVLRVWCVTALGWAAFLTVTLLGGMPRLAGVGGPEEGRARLLFDHPNMAGNYFAISLFVVLAARYPRHPLARAGACALLLLAMVLAGSNAALLSLPIGVVVMVFVSVRGRADVVRAVAATVGLVMAAAVGWGLVAAPILANLEQTNNSLVRYSVARSSRSANKRESLFASQYRLFQDGQLLGIGPASTKESLGEAAATTVKEAHNDYLATLVERGPLGIVALLGLVGAISVRALSVGVNRLSPGYRSVVPNPAAIVGALVSFAFTAVTHEVLHYRHFWTLLAVLAALYIHGRRAEGPFAAKRPLQVVVQRRSDEP